MPNKRIEIVSDVEVRIRRASIPPTMDDAVISMCADYDGHWYIDANKPNRWDAEGRAALKDCINCLEATGSFAALSDESNAAWVGAHRKVEGHGDREWIIYRISSLRAFVYLEAADDRGTTTDCHQSRLLPLVPKQKFRAWTAEQGFREVPPNTHLTHAPTKEPVVVSRFKSWSGGWSVRLTDGSALTPGMLAENYTKSDGSPCGVPE